MAHKDKDRAAEKQIYLMYRPALSSEQLSYTVCSPEEGAASVRAAQNYVIYNSCFVKTDVMFHLNNPEKYVLLFTPAYDIKADVQCLKDMQESICIYKNNIFRTKIYKGQKLGTVFLFKRNKFIAQRI